MTAEATTLTATLTIHLQDDRETDGVALCGTTAAGDERAMSWHEIKRGRISCVPCLTEYGNRDQGMRH